MKHFCKWIICQQMHKNWVRYCLVSHSKLKLSFDFVFPISTNPMISHCDSVCIFGCKLVHWNLSNCCKNAFLCWKTQKNQVNRNEVYEIIVEVYDMNQIFIVNGRLSRHKLCFKNGFSGQFMDIFARYPPSFHLSKENETAFSLIYIVREKHFIAIVVKHTKFVYVLCECCEWIMQLKSERVRECRLAAGLDIRLLFMLQML